MKFKSFITEDEYPILVKDITSSFGDMKVWVNHIVDTDELFLDLEGDTQIPFDKIDEFIKMLKLVKKIK
jgi:uncharacterized damage-inducible protein DinB